MTTFLIILAVFVYLQIGFRYGYYSIVVWKRCETDEAWRSSRAAWLLFPSHAGKTGPWEAGEFPLIAPDFDSPEAYGALLALIWPLKALSSIPFWITRVVPSLLTYVFLQEKHLAGVMKRRRMKMSAAPAVDEAEPATSPAARIEAITVQMSELEAELATLQKRPDAARL